MYEKCVQGGVEAHMREQLAAWKQAGKDLL